MENNNEKHSRATELLAADGPFSEQADKLMLYGQFVGAWDIHSTNFNADGTRIERRGEWHFAWVLGGRGVQDILFAVGAPPHMYGTTLRCYDETADVWRVSWMMPGGREFANLIGRRIGDRIVQEGTGPDPRRLERWTFSDITPTSFIWQGEVSFDQGKTWVLEQEMRAMRRTGS
ncbi:hypothetical protein [Ktedonosporobacter rubrisoli]|uniref:hypothetical protein n=1 Tax=Ktedonosporobacter rubrisoli TaxID=2509675 RepID=UPI001A927957|nr:hypothetical protein [Ktedonosporobacter rubrisoli]